MEIERVKFETWRTYQRQEVLQKRTQNGVSKEGVGGVTKIKHTKSYIMKENCGKPCSPTSSSDTAQRITEKRREKKKEESCYFGIKIDFLLAK